MHLGTVRVDRQAADPMVYMLAVGETLTLPVRLLGQAEPGAIVVSPEGGRLVDGWVALEERPLQLRAGDPTRTRGYVVVGVSPGRETWAGRRHLTRSPLVGRERELLLLDAIIEEVKASRGQVVSLVGAPGMGKSRLLNEFRVSPWAGASGASNLCLGSRQESRQIFSLHYECAVLAFLYPFLWVSLSLVQDAQGVMGVTRALTWVSRTPNSGGCMGVFPRFTPTYGIRGQSETQHPIAGLGTA